jgi:hypothetical protein
VKAPRLYICAWSVASHRIKIWSATPGCEDGFTTGIAGRLREGLGRMRYFGLLTCATMAA